MWFEVADCRIKLGGRPERVVRGHLGAVPGKHDVGERNLRSTRDHFRLEDEPVKAPVSLSV